MLNLKLLAVEFEICHNVCFFFTPIMLILEMFLVLIIRLHFSLKDDEENNQFILDLSVYRSEILFIFPLHFCHSEVLICRISIVFLLINGEFSSGRKIM